MRRAGPFVYSFAYSLTAVDLAHGRLWPGRHLRRRLISKICDAFTDPFEGILSDRTRTRLGRRRPYLMLNYNALQADITLDYQERTTLSSVRIGFSTVASILAALPPLEIVIAYPDVRQGYMVS